MGKIQFHLADARANPNLSGEGGDGGAYLLLGSSSAFPTSGRGRRSLLLGENSPRLKKHWLMSIQPTQKRLNATEAHGAVPVSVCRWQQHNFIETDR